jgi:ABC-type multidrug transport system fused ATPase/permease subunit
MGSARDVVPARGPVSYLWWLVRCQRRRVAAGAVLSTLSMVGLTLPPYLLSRAVDDGLVPGRSSALLGWSAALLGVGVVNAWLSIMRHRTMTRVRMDASFRTTRVVLEQVTRLGASLSRRVAAGEVVTIGSADLSAITRSMTVTGPGTAAVIAYLVVAWLLLSVSAVIAAVVLLGVPVLMAVVGPLLGRLQGVQTSYREGQSQLGARMVDIVEGLRVLNAFGGKQTYAERYRTDSTRLREQGYRVGAVTSWIDALGVGLPAVFLAVVTWMAARLAVQGTITAGQLVAVYGYVAVLVVPVSFFIEGGYDITRGLVAARRVTRFLDQQPMIVDGGGPGPAHPDVLHDKTSGVRVEPGRMTAIVSARPAESAAVVERLGRFVDSDATWGPDRLDAVALTEVRRRILLADNDADLFAGTLRDVLAGRTDRDEQAITHAIHTAAADDVVLGLRHGLDSGVEAHGRNLSGGQRQRIRLARALLTDPEVLLAVEPTSALDAHTEAILAGRLHAARADRTTVVTTTSALLLDHVDTVQLLVDDRVIAIGSHRTLLDTHLAYRDLIVRGDADGTAEADASTATDAR